MANFVTDSELRAFLNITPDSPAWNDGVIAAMNVAAKAHIERLLGYRIEDRFDLNSSNPPPPASLQHALKMLVAHWYENREAVAVGISAQEVPFGVWEIVNEFRDYSFG